MMPTWLISFLIAWCIVASGVTWLWWVTEPNRKAPGSFRKRLKAKVRGPAWRTYIWAFERTSALQRFIAAPYLDRPLSQWPARVGRLLDVSVPQGMGSFPQPTPACPASINNLIALLERTRNVPGDVAECGVYRGAALTILALHAKQTGIAKRFHGFDSFEGFGSDIARDVTTGGADLGCRVVGGMNETSQRLVMAKIRAMRLESIKLYAGYFDHTLKQCDAKRFAFVHLDCDGYAPYLECLRFFYPLMSPDGIILLDEYNDPAWPGCNEAVDEFLAGRPEKLEVIAEGNYQKYYFVKLP